MSDQPPTAPTPTPGSAGHRAPGRTRVDLAGLTLLLIGLISAAAAVWLTVGHGASPLIVAPAALATLTGARHLTKREAGRQTVPLRPTDGPGARE